MKPLRATTALVAKVPCYSALQTTAATAIACSRGAQFPSIFGAAAGHCSSSTPTASPPPSRFSHGATAKGTAGYSGARGGASHTPFPGSIGIRRPLSVQDVAATATTASGLASVLDVIQETESASSSTKNLQLLNAVALRNIEGLEARTVLRLLQLLSRYHAPPDLAVLQDIVAWFHVHATSLPVGVCVQALYWTIQYPEHLKRLVASMKATIVAKAPTGNLSMQATLLVVMLRVLGSWGDVPEFMQLLGTLRDRVADDSEGILQAQILAEMLTALEAAAPFLRRGTAEDARWEAFRSQLWQRLAGLGSEAVARAAHPALLVALAGILDKAPFPVDSIREGIVQRITTELDGGLDSVTRKMDAVVFVALLTCVYATDVVNRPEETCVKQRIIDESNSFWLSDGASLDAAARVLSRISKGTLPPSAVVEYLREFIDTLEGIGKVDPKTAVAPLSSTRDDAALMNVGAGYSADTIRTLVEWLYSCDDTKLRPYAATLADQYYRRVVQPKLTAHTPLYPAELFPLFVNGVVDAHVDGLTTAVRQSVQAWSFDEMLLFLERAGTLQSKSAKALIRSTGGPLVRCVEKASPSQLAALVHCYARAGVRQDDFCDAVSNRAQTVMAEFTLPQLSTLLSGLAAVEYRHSKPFVDASSTVISQVPTSGGPEEVSSLMAAYAKMLVWNFRVFWVLAERMIAIQDQLTIQQLTAGQLALIRMDVQHPRFTDIFVSRVRQLVVERGLSPSPSGTPPLSSPSPSTPNSPLTSQETVVLLSVLSRTPCRDADVIVPLSALAAAEVGALGVDAVAELLMSLARLGSPQTASGAAVFDRVARQAVGMIPTASPVAMTHIISAYALAGRTDAEVFSITADRAVAMKASMAAVTIASLLASFATAGVTNDRLFIEMIPRVRLVAEYGAPRDVANVVFAYSTVKVWHYKLFAKLAERAIQLRGEFRCAQIATVLESYARVGMRYDRLFSEFTPRIQTVVQLFKPSELATVVESYAALNKREAHTVCRVCADRACELDPAGFRETDARKLLEGFASTHFRHAGVVEHLGSQYPALAREYAEVAEVQNDAPEVA